MNVLPYVVPALNLVALIFAAGVAYRRFAEVERLVRKMTENDLPHIEQRLARLETAIYGIFRGTDS